MKEQVCDKGVAYSEAGWNKICYECDCQRFQGSYPEEQLKPDYDGDWDAGYGCDWLGWENE